MIDIYSEDLWNIIVEDITKDYRNVYTLGTFYGTVEEAHKVAQTRVSILEKLYDIQCTWYILESLHGVKLTRLL